MFAFAAIIMSVFTVNYYGSAHQTGLVRKFELPKFATSFIMQDPIKVQGKKKIKLKPFRIENYFKNFQVQNILNIFIHKIFPNIPYLLFLFYRR